MVRETVSIDDPRLDPFRNLKQTNLTRWSNRFVAEGEKVVARLLSSSFETESVLVDEARLDVLDRLDGAKHVLVLPHAECALLTGFTFHQGVLACGVRPVPRRLHDVVAPHGHATVVVSPSIMNPDNLGTLLRLSAAFGVDAVILGRGSADPLSRRSLRVSMGAALAVPTISAGDSLSILRDLRDLDFASIATVLDPGAIDLKDAKRPERLAILFGNEAHGLPPETVAACDRRVTIPMSEAVDSLNISASAAIVLYHFTQVAAAD